ncbi:hypothetical protein SAY87_013287 [Trapa incisa]|uniref:Uncharacterized protein n=1 Tax=Trapa incisa TaxID=236973 RepID=A0AAN7QCY4_9MYRT|nr:hypothetical protein SAY87_013287 [Trapa incisa]
MVGGSVAGKTAGDGGVDIEQVGESEEAGAEGGQGGDVAIVIDTELRGRCGGDAVEGEEADGGGEEGGEMAVTGSEEGEEKKQDGIGSDVVQVGLDAHCSAL